MGDGVLVSGFGRQRAGRSLSQTILECLLDFGRTPIDLSVFGRMPIGPLEFGRMPIGLLDFARMPIGFLDFDRMPIAC